MRLVCPCCGGIFSAEAGNNDITMRQALRLIAEIPAPAGKPVLNYIALFRSPDPESRGLRWDKVLRLLGELTLLIKESHIQFKGGVARKNSATAWAMAMERMIEHPPGRLPIKSHGYLTAIAYEIADEQDKAGEVRRNQLERHGIKMMNDECGMMNAAPVGLVSNPATDESRAIAGMESHLSEQVNAGMESRPTMEEMAEYQQRRKRRQVGGLLNSIAKKGDKS